MHTRLIVLTLVAAGLAHPAVAQNRERIVSITRVAHQDSEANRRVRTETQRRTTERETQTERFTRTVNIGADGELNVSNIAGDIVVTRGGGSTATIEVVKTSRAATIDDARAMLPLVTVDITERGPRAEVRTRYPSQNEIRDRNRRNINVDVAYTISAPQNTRLVVKSISGNVSVSDIAGALTLESVSGTVKIANAGRITSAKSISGDVEATDTRIDGALEAGTISGAVRLRRVSAESVSATSISGDVVFEDVSSSRVEAQSISATVQFAGELQPNGHYEFTAHSGNIRLAVGGKTGFQVEATSFSGGITSDLPITLQGGQSTGRRQRALRGTYGDGSAVVELTAFSGTILITKR
jgi:DUF4097 and DUF4098 domain-containing protein YvlB